MTPTEARELADILMSSSTWSYNLKASEALHSLADQVEALQRDAERYRWLRDSSELMGSTELCDHEMWRWVFWTPAPVIDEHDIDECIDRAREAT
jgi:hypothetical protein